MQLIIIIHLDIIVVNPTSHSYNMNFDTLWIINYTVF